MTDSVSQDYDAGEVMKAELADFLADLEVYRMPFGRYQGMALHRLPYEYLHWFVERADGFPSGRLGELMEFVYGVKANGAEEIFAKVGRRHR